MTDVSAGFRPPCWCPSRWAPTWYGTTGVIWLLYYDLNLGESLCISTFFLFPDSRLNLLNGVYFLFWSIWNVVTLKTTNYYKGDLIKTMHASKLFLAYIKLMSVHKIQTGKHSRKLVRGWSWGVDACTTVWKKCPRIQQQKLLLQLRVRNNLLHSYIAEKNMKGMLATQKIDNFKSPSLISPLTFLILFITSSLSISSVFPTQATSGWV